VDNPGGDSGVRHSTPEGCAGQEGRRSGAESAGPRRLAGRQTKPAQFVIRDAEQLALSHEIDDKNAKDTRFQTDVTADVAQLLKVRTIDWKKQMLVVVAAGAKPTGGYSVEILTLAVKDKTLLVNWKLNSPKPESAVRQARTYPAQMVLTEQFAGPVKFDPPAKDK
jgi:hypothetical protein